MLSRREENPRVACAGPSQLSAVGIGMVAVPDDNVLGILKREFILTDLLRSFLLIWGFRERLQLCSLAFCICLFVCLLLMSSLPLLSHWEAA